MSRAYLISELAPLVSGELAGSDAEVNSVADLETAADGQITFVEKPAEEKFVGLILKTKASCLIVPLGTEIKTSIPLLTVKNPKLAFAQVAKILHPARQRPPEIHPSAIIAESAKIGSDV